MGAQRKIVGALRKFENWIRH